MDKLIKVHYLYLAMDNDGQIWKYTCKPTWIHKHKIWATIYCVPSPLYHPPVQLDIKPETTLTRVTRDMVIHDS